MKSHLLRLGILKLLVLFAAVGIAFVLGELVIRWTGEFSSPPYPPVPKRPDLYQGFDSYGYRLWPSRATTYEYPQNNPRTLSLVSNSDGFRSSREFNEPDDRLRVLVVGDSFVYGDGVEEDERFTDLLEEMEPSWRVDNLGMTGYGPDLMLMALEAVGIDTAPDIIVLVMYTDDFVRVSPYYSGMGYEIPRFSLDSGQLVTMPYPKPRIWEKLHLYQVGLRAYMKFRKIDALVNPELNGAILDRFLELAESHQFTPVLTFLPGTNDTSVDKRRRSWLKQYATKNSVPFLDISEPIHKVERNQIFIRGNPHYNPAGHHIVALELHRFLAEDVIED